MRLMLFKRENCSNCPAALVIVKEVAADIGVSVDVVDADDIDDDLELELLTNRIFIFSVPVVVIKTGEGRVKQFSAGEVPKYEELKIALGGL